MQNLAIWKQALIYLALFMGIGSYVGIVISFIKHPFLNAAFGVVNVNLSPFAGGAFLAFSIISILISAYITAKITNKYLPVSNARNVALIATIIYVLISIIPTLQAYIFADQQFRDFLLPAVNLSMIPAIILPYILFFFLSDYFLKVKS